MDWEALRFAMVDQQIRNRGIRDERVLRAMETIPRHQFVPPEEQLRAYDDAPVSIGLDQTISQPYIVALMTDLLEIEANHRILEVGTGSGYQTALLAMLGQEVFSIELRAALQAEARLRLQAIGLTNVHFAVGNGRLGWSDAAPFDRIMVTAGATDIPNFLVDQLKVGGRMVIPVGPMLEDQSLKVVTKPESSRVEVRETVPVRFVPLVGGSDD